MSDLRAQLARVGREVVRSHLVVGSGGNFSAREPGADEFWVTAAGAWLGELDAGSFTTLQVRSGAVRARPGVRPSSEVALHLDTYRARPDVNAIVHLHPQLAVLLDALGERIRLITTDHAVYVRQIARVPFLPPGSAELAAAAAAAVADGTNCVILAHHGCSVLGESVEMAHRRAANLEEAALLTYRALQFTGLRAEGKAQIPECPSRIGTA